jgi:hypothetical protein
VRHARLSANIIVDLRLFLTFLCQAYEDISMNLLTCRAPDHHLGADACEKGMGGYQLGTGDAWRWAILEEFWGGGFTLNSLEFLESFVTLWIDILQGTITAGDCVRSNTDSTTAQGWMYTSNFNDIDQAVQMSITCKIAEVANAAGIVLDPHWLPGKENIVYDCLSRDHNLTDTQIVTMLRLFFPHRLQRTSKSVLYTKKSSPFSPRCRGAHHGRSRHPRYHKR